ncbi:Uncharacterised protein [Yersinia aleksiciae]|uniref:Uncharacterized protein n=1 Tax=Yersinia aleksiciae TaxID=263819 RepID=A0A0T9TQK4_YERAE|nr:Uncharacterised protein [Yersinia aleksiciae]
MRVFISDLTIRSVNHKLTSLVFCYPSSSINCFLLCSMNRSSFSVTLTFHCPFTIMWNHVLILTHFAILIDTENTPYST